MPSFWKSPGLRTMSWVPCGQKSKRPQFTLWINSSPSPALTPKRRTWAIPERAHCFCSSVQKFTILVFCKSQNKNQWPVLHREIWASASSFVCGPWRSLQVLQEQISSSLQLYSKIAPSAVVAFFVLSASISARIARLPLFVDMHLVRRRSHHPDSTSAFLYIHAHAHHPNRIDQWIQRWILNRNGSRLLEMAQTLDGERMPMKLVLKATGSWENLDPYTVLSWRFILTIYFLCAIIPVCHQEHDKRNFHRSPSHCSLHAWQRSRRQVGAQNSSVTWLQNFRMVGWTSTRI